MQCSTDSAVMFCLHTNSILYKYPHFKSDQDHFQSPLFVIDSSQFLSVLWTQSLCAAVAFFPLVFQERFGLAIVTHGFRRPAGKASLRDLSTLPSLSELCLCDLDILSAKKNGLSPSFFFWICSNLGGGFKYFLFSPLFGEDSKFWLIFFRWVETTTQYQ